MSERKHTPGPWRLSGHSEDSPEKLSVEDGYGYFIAEVDFGLAQKANARLIAAAPELLEALESILASSDAGNAAILDRLTSKARAAIAKATGESK